jgi:hypothetical protein
MNADKAKSMKKNPLYVVTNDGKDVEEAENILDAIVKKFSLGPIIDFLKIIFQVIIDQVGGVVAMDLIKGILDEFVDSLEKLLKMIDPVLAFTIIKR